MGIHIEEKLHAALSGDRTPKFLATLDAAGRPNCVPVITLTPHGEDTLIFGEFFMNKSKKNLLENSKVGIAVINSDFVGWSLKGEFLGFETTGEKVEQINHLPMFRYNAYTSIRAAGTIRITDVSPLPELGKVQLLSAFVRVRAISPFIRGRNGQPACMPLRVREKFMRLNAVRAMAFRAADGVPCAFPVMACLAAGANRLVVSDSLFKKYMGVIPANAEMAVSIITMDPIAYQVKGRFAGVHLGMGVVELEDCYSASPPLLGERLNPVS
ncbi:MAG TPA: pyridoxamine 5'-phosphate oxidase family protein [Candidatus Hydrogenedentes bacterium]|nr:pyridoxamine 5'-phosphate oxidase family protein [Candidatus Hydrogenedentota bacterium]